MAKIDFYCNIIFCCTAMFAIFYRNIFYINSKLMLAISGLFNASTRVIYLFYQNHYILYNEKYSFLYWNLEAPVKCFQMDRPRIAFTRTCSRWISFTEPMLFTQSFISWQIQICISNCMIYWPGNSSTICCLNISGLKKYQKRQKIRDLYLSSII